MVTFIKSKRARQLEKKLERLKLELATGTSRDLRNTRQRISEIEERLAGLRTNRK